MTAEEFKAMFLPHSSRLFRAAYALVGSKTDAEDLVQETYARLWSSRHKLHTINSAEAFALITLRNIYVDSHRAKSVLQNNVSIDQCNSPATDDPIKDIELHNQRDIILKIIGTLPVNQRQVLSMRDIEDMSFDDIEHTTGLSAGNIRTLLSRARKKVKEQYIKLTNHGLK